MSRPTLKLWDGYDHTTPHLRTFVKELQLLLRKENFAVDTDGKFGQGTETAVRNFQWENDLTDDGVVGDGTWGALLGQSGSSSSGSSGSSGASSFSTTYSKTDATLLKDLDEAKKYKHFIDAAADDNNFNPSIIAAIGSRESRWGLALTPPRPAGTGDFVRRSGELPPDGKGWGRGLMQIDYKFHEFARGSRWEDPEENVNYAVGLLDSNRRFYEQRIQLSSDDLLRATIAAYNAGATGVLNSINAGQDIDSRTAHGNYSRDVISRAGWFQLHGWK